MNVINPAVSCAAVIADTPTAASGMYWLKYPGMSAPAQLTCLFVGASVNDVGGDGASSAAAAVSCLRLFSLMTAATFVIPVDINSFTN